ncbi:TrlF family AAA-like ATPase [Fusobacterium polymorphum]
MNNRGSEWRKWDLHLHSIHNNIRGKGDYNGITDEEFIKKILKEKIEVVGLTNYINFSNEDFILAEKLRKNGIVVFLNLELRLTNINDDEQLVDYHIIFSDELSQDEIKNVLSNIEVTVGSSRKVASTIKTKEDYLKAAVDFDSLIKTLSLESLQIKEKYLTGFLSRGHGNSLCKGGKRTYTPYEEIVRKSDIVIHSSALIDNLEKDRNFWLGKSINGSKYIKPLLQSSDAHSLDEIGFIKKEVEEKNKDKTGVYQEGEKYFTNVIGFTWIKADTTFNGLKQIIYEPEERIRYCKNFPDQKADYLVIDSLEYGNSECVFFNSGLNAIIGGRSTGKSTLLNSIAKYQKNKNILNEEHYVLPDKFTVKWRDGEINPEREIEFIPQEFMIDISKDTTKFNKLLQEIIAKKNMDKEERSYREKISIINNKINDRLKEYFSIVESRNSLVKPEGDSVGVQRRIEELRKKVNLIRLENKFTEEENQKYKIICLEFEASLNKLSDIEIEIERLKELNDVNFSIDIDLSKINDKNKKILEMKLMEIKDKSDNLWKKAINEISININKDKVEIEKKVEEIEKSDIFMKGKDLESRSFDLKEIETAILKETEILKRIESYDAQIKVIDEKRKNCIQIIVNEFLKKQEEIENLKNRFSILENELLIGIKPEIIEFTKNIDYLHAKNKNNNNFIDEFCKTMNEEYSDNFKEILLNIFDKTDLLYNQNKNINNLIRDIFSCNWYNYNYVITYQNDEFKNMSQGKKSFVILKLLLEFNDDKKPVLIDQPEDSLDNKAIYHELRKYILDTKKDRQIIIVTHNPNVVVGSDAENIIIANQHNNLEKNKNGNKFQYVNGSLESSRKKDKNCEYILESQGIREHIFDILEGGAEAFAKREQKYNFRK